MKAIEILPACSSSIPFSGIFPRLLLISLGYNTDLYGSEILSLYLDGAFRIKGEYWEPHNGLSMLLLAPLAVLTIFFN